MKLKSVHRISVVFVLIAALSLVATPAHADNDGSSVGIGVDWVGNYTGTGSPAARYGNLSTPDECVAGLYDIVKDPNTSWGWVFNWGNSNAWELDFKRPSAGGNAARLADDVDLVAFSGHGLGNNFTFGTNKSDWYATPSDMDLGLRDCEWMLTYTCNFLRGVPADFGSAANGVHLICGYATDMTITANGGSQFASFAKPSGSRQAYGVRVAWYKYGQQTQSGANRNIARTFGAKTAVNDYLWGYGSVSSDPVAYSPSTADKYAYWDTKLNW